MDENRLPKACYQLSVRLDNAGRKTWATYIRNMLERYGFGIVWLNQGVGDWESFLKMFKQRLIDCYHQEWSTVTTTTNKLRYYIGYKIDFMEEKYLSCVPYRRHRVALAKLRTSNHCLQSEIGRSQNTLLENRSCTFCSINGNHYIENEYHVVMECPLYKDIRSKFIGGVFTKDSSVLKFNRLMSTSYVPQKIDLAILPIICSMQENTTCSL